ncbi:MAG: FlgD immunoglobulin-like domain containing protein [Candidatus Cloacimonadales bacterium]
MKKLCILIMLLAATGVFARQIQLTVHLANAETDGDIMVEAIEPDGSYSVVAENEFYAGDTEVIAGDINGMIYVNEEVHLLQVFAVPSSSDPELVYLEPGVSSYNAYYVFDDPDLYKTLDLDFGAGIVVNTKSYFMITGRVRAQDSGNGNQPSDFGLRVNVNSTSNNLNRDFYVTPIENWNTWYDFEIKFSEDYAIGSDLFFYPGGNTINVFLATPAGEERMLYMDNVKLTFEYVPDYTSEIISVESYNLSGDEWHPKISWSLLNGFPAFWENYFEIEIWRQVNQYGQTPSDWTCIATKNYGIISYIDEEYNTAGAAGKFGAIGELSYKIKLVQKSNNPNYDATANIPNDEEWDDTFGFSISRSIIYGETSGTPGGSSRFNQPNLVNDINVSSSTISYSVNDSNPINTNIEMYNVKGQLINTFCQKKQNGGRYEITWNGKAKSGSYLSSGIYFLKVSRGSFKQFNKFSLVK